MLKLVYNNLLKNLSRNYLHNNSRNYGNLLTPLATTHTLNLFTITIILIIFFIFY